MSGLGAASRPSLFAGVTRYHWLVVIIASAGWLFDCMDQRLFVLARESALKELLAGDPRLASVKSYIGYATTAMILGWATGGIIFGVMSDRLGGPAPGRDAHRRLVVAREILGREHAAVGEC